MGVQSIREDAIAPWITTPIVLNAKPRVLGSGSACSCGILCLRREVAARVGRQNWDQCLEVRPARRWKKVEKEKPGGPTILGQKSISKHVQLTSATTAFVDD